MMKPQNKFLSILLFLTVLFTIIPISYADPVFVHWTGDEILPLILFFSFLMLNFTIAVELGTFLLFFKNKIEDRPNFFKAVISVNLITFPITQILALFVFSHLSYLINIWNYILIELFPITLEYLLYLRLFKEVLLGEIRNNMTFISTITANLLTFIIGTFLFIQLI